jgi:hypothetical protein
MRKIFVLLFLAGCTPVQPVQERIVFEPRPPQYRHLPRYDHSYPDIDVQRGLRPYQPVYEDHVVNQPLNNWQLQQQYSQQGRYPGWNR